MKKLLFTLTLCAAACSSVVSASTLVSPEKATEMLHNHEKHFTQRVVQVAPNVYTAIGYHGANTSMIVGDDGVIIVDTLMGPTSAANAFRDLRKYSDKPVKAIIYTHSHGDHTGGASVFAEGNKDVTVIGNANMGHEHGTDKSLDKLMVKRGIRQFGRKLPPEEQTNRGVAPAITIDFDRAKGFLPVTEKVSGDYKTTIAGIDLEIYPAAGETDDAMFIWLPKEKVLFSGDNFYQVFPNLYAIRGTPYRDVRNWANSVAKMATFEPEYLVPGHTSPIIGKEKATSALQNYSDAIQYVFDQTIAGMNKGLDPVTIGQNIELPDHLKNQPYLTEFYGSISHASRAIFSGMVGWFDGNPVNLNPLSNKEKAQNLVKLAGSDKALVEQMDKAFANKEYEWALMLADNLAYIESVDQKHVLQMKIDTLRALAAMEYNAPNRNYYFTYANELEAQQKTK